MIIIFLSIPEQDFFSFYEPSYLLVNNLVSRVSVLPYPIAVSLLVKGKRETFGTRLFPPLQNCVI